jgi:hypothetical protein
VTKKQWQEALMLAAQAVQKNDGHPVTEEAPLTNWTFASELKSLTNHKLHVKYLAVKDRQHIETSAALYFYVRDTFSKKEGNDYA